MENFRTFVALPVKVGSRFLKARAELIDSLKGERISWVDRSRFHVTLRFLGDTEERDVEAIGNSLREHVKLPPVTKLKFDRVGSFGPRKRPRVVWVGFEESSLFHNLKIDVDSALERVGIPPEEQPFRAHLTLGRVRSMRELQEFYQIIEKMKDNFKEELSVESLVFYRSELKSDGPVYTPLTKLGFSSQTPSPGSPFR
ncbi:MAG: RNA 2',3'-cyclic phosphodiesterase [Bacteroidota bacterium]